MTFSARQILWLLTAIFFSLVSIAVLQFGLNSDGAHYALYGQHLALSYYDHPPLVGWLEALAFKCFGVNDFSAMSVPLVTAFATIVGCYQLTNRWFSDRAPWVGLLAVVGLFNVLVFSIWVFDLLPQSVFILCAGLCTYQLSTLEKSSAWSRWLVAGLYLGLAGLADYTVLPFCFGIVLYLLLYKRELFLSPRLYAAGLLALAVFSPVIIWNVQHDFASFQYQLNHGLHRAWSWKHFFTSLLLQCVYYNPLLVALMGVAVLRAPASLIKKLCLCLSLPILGLFFYSGGHQVVLPHWTATGWLLLLPVTAAYVQQCWQQKPTRVLAYGAVGLSMVFYILGYGFIGLHFMRFPVNKDPLRDLYGWQEAGQYARLLQKYLDQKTGAEHQVFVLDWHHAGRLAWYGQTPVQVADNVQHQFQYWYGKPNAQSDGILVVPTGSWRPAIDSSVQYTFQHCYPLDTLTTRLHGKPFNQYRFYHCQHFLT